MPAGSGGQGRPFRDADTSVLPRYTSLREKNGASCASRRRKMRSPSQSGRPGTALFSTHASSPSTHGPANVPSNASEVKRCIYSVGHTSDTNVTSPRYRQSVSIRPVSSRTSRSRQSSGLSPSSHLPPTPIHLPSFSSLAFLVRCSIRQRLPCSM